MLLARKEEARRLEAEGDEGMMHAVLAQLPNIELDPWEPEEIPENKLEARPTSPRIDGHRNASSEAASSTTLSESESADESDLFSSARSEVDSIATSIPTETETAYKLSEKPVSDTASVSSTSNTAPSTPKKRDHGLEEKQPLPWSDVDSPAKSAQPRALLSDFLRKADALYNLYPPTHPAIDAFSIIGPASIISTWSEDPHLLPTDDEAEATVRLPLEQIVLPFEEEEEDADDEDSQNGYSKRRKRGRGSNNKGRQVSKLPRISLKISRRMMLTGAVVLVGVAIALYRNGGARDPSLHAKRDLKRWKTWVVRVLLGVGHKFKLGPFR
jgi:TBC1 domain family member 20